MAESARYAIPGARHSAELMIERSRFRCTIASAQRAEDAQALIRACNVEFPDASHHCWAYVIGPPGTTDRVGLSDDGEPHGTAGRPMLTVLLHSGVGDVVAVVTRWFGGTKLGTGGLVKAYSAAVQHAMESMPRASRVDYAYLDVRTSYAHISALMQLWPTFEVEVLVEEFAEDVRFAVRFPREHEMPLRRALLDATGGRTVLGTTTDELRLREDRN